MPPSTRDEQGRMMMMESANGGVGDTNDAAPSSSSSAGDGCSLPSDGVQMGHSSSEGYNQTNITPATTHSSPRTMVKVEEGRLSSSSRSLSSSRSNNSDNVSESPTDRQQQPGGAEEFAEGEERPDASSIDITDEVTSLSALESSSHSSRHSSSSPSSSDPNDESLVLSNDGDDDDDDDAGREEDEEEKTPTPPQIDDDEATRRDSDTDDATSKMEKKKGVSFSTVEIAEHPIIVGDNPGGIRGCPISIGWESVRNHSFDLNEYESVRNVVDVDDDDDDDDGSQHSQQESGFLRIQFQPSRPQRRISTRMTSAHRENTLRGLGFSREEILQGSKNASRIRNRRHSRNRKIHWDRFHERVESVQRKVRNVWTLGKKKRQERNFLIKYYVESHQHHHDSWCWSRLQEASSNCHDNSSTSFARTCRTSISSNLSAQPGTSDETF